MAWIQKEESDDHRRNRHYLWRHGSRRPQGRSESPFPLLDHGEARQGQLLLLLSLRRILAGRLCPSWKGQGSTCTKSWLVVCKSVLIEHFSGNSPTFVHCHAQLCCAHRNTCTRSILLQLLWNLYACFNVIAKSSLGATTGLTNFILKIASLRSLRSSFLRRMFHLLENEQLDIIKCKHSREFHFLR